MLARAGERADVTVYPMHHSDVFYALPDFSTDLLRTWVVPGAAAIAALTAAAVLGHIATTGLAAAVVLTCAAILLAVPARPAPAPELRNVRARVLAAWAVLVAAVTSGYLLILAPLAAGVAQRRPIVASVALGVVLLIEVLLAWRELAGRWITGYSMLAGVPVAVAVGTGPPVPGVIIGLLAGALCAVVLLFCSTTHIVAQPPRSIVSQQAGQRTRQREVLQLVVAAAVLLLPWPVRFAGAGLAAAMVLAGMLVFYPIAAALSHPLLRYSARVALRVADTPDPWSRRFLGYAADRGLLVKARWPLPVPASAGTALSRRRRGGRPRSGHPSPPGAAIGHPPILATRSSPARPRPIVRIRRR